MSKNAETDTNDSIKDDVDHLKEDLALLREDLRAIFGDLKGYASVQAKEGVEKGKAFATDAGEQIDAVRDDLQDKIREKPLTAVGLAFGAGLLIALLGRK